MLFYVVGEELDHVLNGLVGQSLFGLTVCIPMGPRRKSVGLVASHQVPHMYHFFEYLLFSNVLYNPCHCFS